MEELKEVCCSGAEGTQELREDDCSRHELRESQSTANQLTVQFQELQDTENFLYTKKQMYVPHFQSIGQACMIFSI